MLLNQDYQQAVNKHKAIIKVQIPNQQCIHISELIWVHCIKQDSKETIMPEIKNNHILEKCPLS